MKKKLRQGFTTGTCAAIAAKAATKILFGESVEKEWILTPKGIRVETSILECKQEGKTASCAVKKDAGDDPDVTNGMLIFASVVLTQDRKITVKGGEGIGTVTKAGLSQQIGEAAINPVPMQMITKEVKEVLEKKGSFLGCQVTIWAPQGTEIARKTFNPRIGIEGGISILGTTGIVEPMSERALLESIGVELNVAKANTGDCVILTPGNYGEEFIRNTLHISLSKAVKCSNFIGETIDMAVEKGFQEILLVGHIGKLIKLAAGIMNTHSHVADGRMEIFVAHAALCGAPREILRQIMNCVATDEAIRILTEYEYLDSTMASIMERIRFHLKQRCLEERPVGAILFSNQYGILGVTQEGYEILEHIEKERG